MPEPSAKIFVIGRHCATTPGYAKKAELACLGCYAEARIAPAFISEDLAQAYLNKWANGFHPIKPHYAGQKLEVFALELQDAIIQPAIIAPTSCTSPPPG